MNTRRSNPKKNGRKDVIVITLHVVVNHRIEFRSSANKNKQAGRRAITNIHVTCHPVGMRSMVLFDTAFKQQASLFFQTSLIHLDCR